MTLPAPLVYADGSGKRFRGGIGAIAISADGQQIAAADAFTIDGDERGLIASVPQVAFFAADALDEEPIRAHMSPELFAPEVVPESVSFTSDGETLVASLPDRLVMIPVQPNIEEISELRDNALSEGADPSRAFSAVSLSADDSHVAIGRRDGSVSLLGMQDAESAVELVGGVGAVEVVGISPDGARVLAVSDGELGDEETEDLAEQTAVVWDAASGEQLSKVSAQLGYEVAFGPGGTVLGSFPNEDGWTQTIRIWNPWDPRGPVELAAFTAPVELSCIAVHPSGSRLVSGDADGRIAVWEFPEEWTIPASLDAQE
jgi:WD40 repeat protein